MTADGGLWLRFLSGPDIDSLSPSRADIVTAVGLIETSGGQEDVQSFAWEAAGKLRAALRHARAITACELLTGYQAAALSRRPPSEGCRALLDWLAAIIGPIEGDRPFGEDLERLIQAPWPPLTRP